MKKLGNCFKTAIVLSLLILWFPAWILAQEDTGMEELDVSLGELLNLELVTATKRKISVRKAPAITAVITGDEIRNMGARNLRDVLKMVPGFGLSINEWGRDMFEVRGIRTTFSEKILVMVDGHRLNDPYSGSALFYKFDELSVEKAKQIEIIRGPGSALYGANAFVSVINVITKAAEDVDGFEAGFAAGNYDTLKISVTGGKAVDENLNILGCVDYSDTRRTDETIEADSLSGTPFSTTPGEAEMSLEKKEAFFKISHKDLTFRGHYLENKDEGVYIGLGNALTDENYATNTNFWADLNYTKAFADSFAITFRAYFDRWHVDADWEILPEGFPGYPDGMIGRPSLKTRTVGGELQFDFDISENNHLIAGINYEYVKQYDVTSLANFDPYTNEPLGSVLDVSSWGNFNRDVTRKVWAAYVQDEWGILDSLNLTAGVRYDHYDDFGGTVNPRAGVVWNFLENADLKVLYGQAFRAPSFQELYNDGNPVLVGSPDLDPEKIKTYEAGLGYAIGKSHMINVNYFFNEIEDLITADTSTRPGRYINSGSVEVNGVEIIFKGQYGPSNYWQMAYTWQDPKNADTDEALPDVPSHRAAFSVNHEICKYLAAHADVLWTGERPRAEGDPRDDMSSYTTVDLTLIAKNFYKGLEIRGMIHNLLDEEYEDPDTSGAAQAIPGDYPREGISALIELGYHF